MTRVEPSRRLDSIGLLGGTPVTVVGRGQVTETAAEILRVVGAAVAVVVPASLRWIWRGWRARRSWCATSSKTGPRRSMWPRSRAGRVGRG